MTNAVNKKYKITVIALAIGVIMMLGAVIGVWAASTQNINVGFNVMYEVGDNVGVEVRTEFYVPNMDSDNDGEEDGVKIVSTNSAGTTITDEKGYIPFNAEDESGEKELAIGNIALTAKAQKIEYYFTFHSLQDKDFVQVAFWMDFATKNNILVDYWYAYADNTFDVNTSASTIAEENWSLNQLDNVSAEGYKFIKVVLEVGNQNAKANSSGMFNFILNRDETIQSVSTLSKTKLSNAIDQIGADFLGETLYLKYTNDDMSNVAGIDISEAGDGSIKISGTTIWAKNTICLPEDSSSLFSYLAPSEDAKFYNFIFQNIDTSNVTNMSAMLNGWRAIGEVQGLEKFDTSQVTNMAVLFCGKDGELDLTQFDTSNVVVSEDMFEFATLLKNVYIGDLWTLETTPPEGYDFAFIRK